MLKRNIQMKAILTISHTDYTHSLGGIEKVLLEQSEVFMDSGYNVVHICPNTTPFAAMNHTLFSTHNGYDVLVNNKKKVERADITEVLACLGEFELCKIVIHSLIGMNESDVNRLISHYKYSDILFYIHDYKTVCTGQVLLKNKSKYCGADGRKFVKCMACRFYWEGLSVYRYYSRFIEANPNVTYIFPSEIARTIWSTSYSNVSPERLKVIPHQKLLGETVQPHHENDRLRIAYVGYKSFNKGWKTFRTLYSNDKKKQYDYYVLGKTNEILPNVKQVSVSFIDDGPDAMIKALRNNEIDVALLWSPWPETYSYTFYESYVGGAFILTNPNSGNIQAQVYARDCGKVLVNEDALLKYCFSGELNKDVKGDKNERPTRLEMNDEELKEVLDI